MSAPDRAKALADVRDLTKRSHRGGNEGADAFKKLVGLLLQLTVLRRNAAVNRYRLEDGKYLIGGPRKTFDPLPLRGGGFLAVAIQFYVDSADRNFLKVSKARYQYQLEPSKDRWVFRYEYLRDPPDHHPCAHLHVRGRLEEENGLPRKELLEGVHFPTERVPLEAIIRLLVDHFGIRCATPETVWQPALFEAEEAFRRIAHKPRNPRQAGGGE